MPDTSKRNWLSGLKHFLDARRISLISRIAVGCLAVIAANSCRAQDTAEASGDSVADTAGDNYVARSVGNPGIAVDRLKIIIKPLKVEQVEAEAKAWYELLYEQSQAIAAKQLASKEQGGDDEGATEAKTQALEEIVELKLAQTDLMERLSVVIESLKLKGGDTAEYESYVAAQRGIELDTSDTAATWAAIKGWLRSDEGGVKWLWRLVHFSVTLLITMVFSGVISRLVKRWLDKSSRLSQLAEDLIARSIRNVLLLLGLLIAITSLGVDIGPLLAALGATGFIIGFALQGTLSNFASGLMILLNRPFDVGDVVQAGGVSGTVSAMNLVSTTFATFDNQKIIVPNNEIWDNVITNVTARETRRIDLVFGVGYDEDLKRVEELLADVVREHPQVLSDPEPTIKVHELADSSVNFICRPWAKTEDYWAVYWDVMRTVKERFDAAGISIPYPQRDVHLHQPPLQT